MSDDEFHPGMISYDGEGQCRQCEGWGCFHQVWQRTARYLVYWLAERAAAKKEKR